MSERSLSRRVATTVVEALKAKGHILVVKGGSEALVREIDALMAEQLTQVSAGVAPRTVVGEVTSTFGDEAIDEAVEEMVGGLARALMDSDHVEDVFAEDNVIRRDIFRAVRDTLLQAPDPDAESEEEEEEEAGPISVRLDTLGYVASTVAKRADAETLRDALERAALAAEGQLASLDVSGREALFTMPTGDPDARLELEEAVADELTDLVDMGLVELPAMERKVPLVRPISDGERRLLKPRIDLAMQRTLQRAGYAASWDITDPQTLMLTLTPLSEQDARAADQHAAQFAREVNAALAEDRAAASTPEASSPGSSRPTRASSTEENLDADLEDDDAVTDVVPNEVVEAAASEASAAGRGKSRGSAGPAQARKPAKSAPPKRPAAKAPGKAATSSRPPSSKGSAKNGPASVRAPASAKPRASERATAKTSAKSKGAPAKSRKRPA